MGLDEYFLTDEEKIIALLKSSERNRVSFKLGDKQGELKAFKFENYEALSRALKKLHSQHLVFRKTDYGPLLTTVGLVKRFIPLLHVEVRA